VVGLKTAAITIFILGSTLCLSASLPTHLGDRRPEPALDRVCVVDGHDNARRPHPYGTRSQGGNGDAVADAIFNEQDDSEDLSVSEDANKSFFKAGAVDDADPDASKSSDSCLRDRALPVPPVTVKPEGPAIPPRASKSSKKQRAIDEANAAAAAAQAQLIASQAMASSDDGGDDDSSGRESSVHTPSINKNGRIGKQRTTIYDVIA